MAANRGGASAPARVREVWRLAFAAAIGVATLVGCVGCGGPALGKGGSACAVATDCESGLVCIPSQGKCSSDLSPLVPSSNGVFDAGDAVNAGHEAGAPDGAATVSDASEAACGASDVSTESATSDASGVCSPPDVQE